MQACSSWFVRTLIIIMINLCLNPWAVGKIKIPIDQLRTTVVKMDSKLLGNEESISALLQVIKMSMYLCKIPVIKA
jgi:hypothetical protein